LVGAYRDNEVENSHPSCVHSQTSANHGEAYTSPADDSLCDIGGLSRHTALGPGKHQTDSATGLQRRLLDIRFRIQFIASLAEES